MNLRIYLILFVFTFISISCTESVIGDTFNNDSQIKLIWFPSYSGDDFQKNKIALEWCLSYLGANIASQSPSLGVTSNSNTITLDIDQLGFTKKAITELKKLHHVFKNSEEYRIHKAFDLGKYIAMTLGSSYHYYKIVDAPEHIDYYATAYHFNQLKGYIDDSSVSLTGVHRIIKYSTLSNNNRQIFISSEIDPNTQEVKEFESLERMPNGQLKFAIFDVDGFLIPNAKSNVSRGGKPAKCLWCHEVNILPLFKQQNNFTDFLSFAQLTDTLNFYNFQLKTFQDNSWNNPSIQNKALHTNMELSYISYMEPTAERLALEWNISNTEVQILLNQIDTHRHDEFDFLGDLYHRSDINAFAPFETIKPPSSIREESSSEPNLLK